MKHDPIWLNHADARWDWLRAVVKAPFSPTERLVSHTLCLHGRADGAGIFPSTRLIAEESGLSERSVCTAIETLTCTGYLWPDFMEKRSGQAWARTLYKLTAPRKVWDGVGPKPWDDDPTWKPEIKGTERPSVPQGFTNGSGTQGTERHAEGTETGAEGTERHDRKALKEVQSSLSSESLNVVTQRECALRAPAFAFASEKTKTKEEEAAEAEELREVEAHARVRSVRQMFPQYKSEPETIAKLARATLTDVQWVQEHDF